MKTILLFIILLLPRILWAQEEVNDEALRYQTQRMVFQQWDQNKFKPTSGFLGLNPYYWLIWGWYYPNYHKTDMRPLSSTGPQTQRIALVGAMNSTDNSYKLSADNIRQTAESQLATQSGLLSDADPLWLLYYSSELKPVLENTPTSILSGLSPKVSGKLVSEGTYNWYKNELDMLKERIQGARTTNMDRGSRILSYHRFLQEYRRLSGVWNTRTAAAASTIDMTATQQKIKSGNVSVPDWTPSSDVSIAKKVLSHVQ